MRNANPIRLKEAQDGIQYQIDLYSKYLQGLKEAYKSILGVEYGSMQTHKVYKATMNDYLSSTLYRRGITKVEYEEDASCDDWVTLYWQEVIKEE